ncbi:ABC transporter permease [Nakamurella antarctica]|uniref:Xylose transport system permease protein XylH n=2 Tax=Nakamurella antarctica TaxID=1902245 RepID=A0A3G8ZWK2_9ACTN|nr:ABC transporter permease [Nakamurella antarctica]
MKTDLESNSLEARVRRGHSQTVAEEMRAYIAGLRGGNMGSMPAVAGLVLLVVLFSIIEPIFFTTLNFANLLQQSAPLIVLAMGLVFVLLLGEIDLSAGVTSGLTSALLVIAMTKAGFSWWLASLVAIAAGVLIGLGIGVLVAKVGIPSFIVTLAAFLAFQGLQLLVIGQGGLYSVTSPVILSFENGNVPPTIGWVLVAVAVAATFGLQLNKRRRRVALGHANQPFSAVVLRVGVLALALVVGVFLLNQERSRNPLFSVRGVPVVVLIVAVVFLLGVTLLQRTKFGLHIYAVGGNDEASRRAGISVSNLRVTVFIIGAGLAAVSGILTASRIGTVDASAGRTIVLNGIAAAVVGGVSLFGGRGKLKDAIIGGLVIAVIDNGLGLLGLPSGLNLAITGSVLLMAATADALSRKQNKVRLR